MGGGPVMSQGHMSGFSLVNEMLNPFWRTVAVVGLLWVVGSDKID